MVTPAITILFLLLLMVATALFPMAVIWTISIVAASQIIGVLVLSSIDDDQQTLFRWAASCPLPGGYNLVLILWPLVAFFWLRRKK